MGVDAKWRMGVDAKWRMGVDAKWRMGVDAKWRLRRGRPSHDRTRPTETGPGSPSPPGTDS